MSELAANARDYVANNAAESGADVLITQLAARIEALEAALREIASGGAGNLYAPRAAMIEIARAALDKDNS